MLSAKLPDIITPPQLVRNFRTLHTQKGREMEKDKKRKALPPHWYLFYSVECVLCCAGFEKKRIRQYTQKPEDISDRILREQFICDYHSTYSN